MFCTNCGKEVADGQPFCTKCGYPLGGGKKVPAPGTETVIRKKQQSAKKARGYIAAILILLLLIAAGGGGIWYLWNTDDWKMGMAAAKAEEEAAPEPDLPEEEPKPDEPLVATPTEETEEEEKPVQEEPDKADIPEDALRYNGHSYAVFNVSSKIAETWDEAEEYCESLGGYLAIINSEEENQALYQYVYESTGGYAFFGFSDQLVEGRWIWVDGSLDSGYTKWGVDANGNPEPNSDSVNEDYAEFTPDRLDGSWNDSRFGFDTYAFICEWNYS